MAKMFKWFIIISLLTLIRPVKLTDDESQSNSKGLPSFKGIRTRIVSKATPWVNESNMKIRKDAMFPKDQPSISHARLRTKIPSKRRNLRRFRKRPRHRMFPSSPEVANGRRESTNFLTMNKSSQNRPPNIRGAAKNNQNRPQNIQGAPRNINHSRLQDIRGKSKKYNTLSGKSLRYQKPKKSRLSKKLLNDQNVQNDERPQSGPTGVLIGGPLGSKSEGIVRPEDRRQSGPRGVLIGGPLGSKSEGIVRPEDAFITQPRIITRVYKPGSSEPIVTMVVGKQKPAIAHAAIPGANLG